MSIRLLAKDLYRLQREVEAVEQALAAASWQQAEEIRSRLRALKAERDRLRAALDGQKDSSLGNKPNR